jgi:hypothetical protein
MATWKHELSQPPTEPRALELWLQHAAGFIVFQDIRRYAKERIDPALTEDSRAAAEKAIDDTVYGLMMVIDGVTGRIANDNHAVYIDFIARLATRGDAEDGRVVSEIDLRKGDGMCMGYHGWLEDDFGEYPIAVPRPGTAS